MTKPDYFCTGRKEGHVRSSGVLKALLKRRRWGVFAGRAQQVHRSLVKVVPKLSAEMTYPDADGLLTREIDQPLAIFTADCVPIFLSVESVPAVGVLHAGWRGVHAQILKQALKQLRQEWAVKPLQVEVWVGPSIGVCCFDVQWDVAKHFPFSRRRRNDRWTVDLVAELKRQSKNLGVRWKASRSIERCTMHEPGYFSYRRDKTDDRQVSVIRMV